jgi:CxxC-x17-CxxC domain-containing protein
MKSRKPKASVAVDPYLEGLMGKLLDRLMSLEKKMDTIIAQAPAKMSLSHTMPKPASLSEPNKPPARHDRTLYEAICADCHKVCEVPFRPTEARPVYCKDCFAVRKSGGRPNSFPINLTPVSLPPKPVSKLGAAVRPLTKKAKKKNK